VFTELPRRTENGPGRTGCVVGIKLARELLTILFRQQRLRIEQVHLARTTKHEQVDHRVGAGGDRQLLRSIPLPLKATTNKTTLQGTLRTYPKTVSRMALAAWR